MEEGQQYNMPVCMIPASLWRNLNFPAEPISSLLTNPEATSFHQRYSETPKDSFPVVCEHGSGDTLQGLQCQKHHEEFLLSPVLNVSYLFLPNTYRSLPLDHGDRYAAFQPSQSRMTDP
jgi:hypothetical protein